MTPSLSSKNASNTSEMGKGLMTTVDSGCTTGCTSDGKSEPTDPLAALAAAVMALSPGDRARLAAMLQTGQG